MTSRLDGGQLRPNWIDCLRAGESVMAGNWNGRRLGPAAVANGGAEGNVSGAGKRSLAIGMRSWSKTANTRRSSRAEVESPRNMVRDAAMDASGSGYTSGACVAVRARFIW